MDFYSLARRDLQFLCKKNRIPANLTNVAMAKALEALETVAGIEEIQEVLEFQCTKAKSPELPHTSLNTSSHGATHGDGSKIRRRRQQQQSPLPRKTMETLEIKEMASKEDEIQETLGCQSLKSLELPRTGRRTSARRAALGEEPKIQQQKPSPLYRSLQAAAKDSEVTEIASEQEEGEKKEIPTILPKTPATRKAAKRVEAPSSKRRANTNKEIEGHTETVEAKGGKAIGMFTRRSNRLSSRKALEETATTQPKSRSSGRNNSAVKMEALAKDDTEVQEKEEKKEDRAEYRDSCAVIVKEHEKNDQETKMVAVNKEDEEEQLKEEEKLDDGKETVSCVVAPVEEDEEEDKKEESHGYSFSIEVESGDSIVALVEEVEENGQEGEIHGFSSSTQGEDTNNENGDSAVVLVQGDEKNDQELEIQALPPSIEVENSNDNSNVVLVEEEGRNVQGEGEVSCDLLPANEAVEDSGNQSPTNEAVEDSGDHSSNTKLAISAVSDNLQCSEMRPLLHEEAIVRTQGSSKIEEEEEGKLILLFTEMTLKEPEEQRDPLLEPVVAQGASFVPTKLPAAMAIAQYDDLVSNSNIIISPLYSENDLGNEAIRESPEEVKESGGVLPSKIPDIEESIDDDPSEAGEVITNYSSFEPPILVSFPAADSTIGFPDEVKDSCEELPSHPEVNKESFEDKLMDSSKLAANDFVDVLQKAETSQDSFFELPASSSELCFEFSAVDAPQKTQIFQGGSFELHSSVSCAELWSEFLADSSVEFMEAFGDLPSEISAEINESIKANLQNSRELTAENSELILVPCTTELCAATAIPTISSTLKLPCESETMSLEELSIVQTQSSEEAGMAATEIAEEKEEEVFLKDGNLEDLSLIKLRAMYKQMLNGTKTEQERKKSTIKEEDLECLNSIKHDENCKQKLDDDMIKFERSNKISVIKQEDLCESLNKLNSNSKQKLNDDKIKSERKRTPLKNLNYSTF